ncbi:extracellular solute-binding protein [Pelagibacterales bacterium]|nr:extracellular solute-binding protein [Pelagibacterales bacterium]
MNLFTRILQISLAVIIFSASSFANEVNLYISKDYDSDEKLYAKFTAKTGIKVNVISGKGKALMQQILTEGNSSPADLFLTLDAGNLWKAQKERLFEPIDDYDALSIKIRFVIPDNLRGPNNEWVALAKRARIMYYNPKTVTAAELDGLTYEDLAKPEWNGRLVIGKSSNMYNQSLVASLVANHGVDATEAWANGLVANMARKPEGNDRAQIMAVANGEAYIAVANSYYIALMLSGKKGTEQQAAANKVVPFFPSQNGRGTHINVSGIGLLKNGPNKGNAVKLVEFLLSEEAQNHIVNNSFEYPLRDGVNAHPLIAQFGTDFKQDQTPVSSYGEFNPDAVKLMERAGW